MTFDIEWAVRVPLRDGVTLSANVYRPRDAAPRPCILTLSPYGVQRMHERGAYFAQHGYIYVIVDCRGRGNSEGQFQPFIQEARDGCDLVEWLARRPGCNGQVAMWGGSYLGYAQWATVKEKPAHLATMVPAASAYPGHDFPMRGNVSSRYVARWLSFVSSRATQDHVFGDSSYWTRLYREHFEAGRSFAELAGCAGDNGATFAEWVRHPTQDDYWDAHAPSPDEYAAIDIPILTITGIYDGDQLGSLTYYRNHMRYGTRDAAARHYLVIGPWDHARVALPDAAFGGMTLGPLSVIDMNQLNLDWYNWTLGGGARPTFLKDRVVYYVTGADQWRSAPFLEAVTEREEAYYLRSNGLASDVFSAGSLEPSGPTGAAYDEYFYDPRQISQAQFEVADSESLVDQRGVFVGTGRQVVYHSRPFNAPIEISGSFRLSAWIAIDQPDTDFKVTVYEIAEDGGSLILSFDQRRARYRQSLRCEELIRSREPLLYDFTAFTFTARQIQRNSRLRLVIEPMGSISQQKNYNSGAPVSDETLADARMVTVRVYHDAEHPSVLYVPLGRTRSDGGQ